MTSSLSSPLGARRLWGLDGDCATAGPEAFENRFRAALWLSLALIPIGALRPVCPGLCLARRMSVTGSGNWRTIVTGRRPDNAIIASRSVVVTAGAMATLHQMAGLDSSRLNPSVSIRLKDSLAPRWLKLVEPSDSAV